MTCNSEDREGRCDANDGEPCDACVKARADEMLHWLRAWNVATYEEKYGREAYEAQLREAGRKS